MRTRRTFHLTKSEGRRRGKRRRGRNAAMLSVVTDEAARRELAMSLDELAREGARRMLAAALEAEVDAYIATHADQTDERGHRLVRRNGHAPARQLVTGAGQVEVTRPRVDDRRVDPAIGQRAQFHSQILPRWCRRSPKVAAVLTLLYLHGLSSQDFVPALTELFGSAAGGLPRHPRAAMLGPQSPKYSECAAQECPRRCPQGVERDHPGRGPRACTGSDRGVRQRLRRQVAQ